MKESDESAVPVGLVAVEGFGFVGEVRNGFDGRFQHFIAFGRKAQCGKDGGAAAMNVSVKGAQFGGKRIVGVQNDIGRERGGRFGLVCLHGESFG